MTVYEIEYERTPPGERPGGDGWKCIHAGCSPDGERWWLWSRTVPQTTLRGETA